MPAYLRQLQVVLSFNQTSPLLSLCRVLLLPENYGGRKIIMRGGHLQALASAVEAIRTDADDSDITQAGNLVTDLNVAAIALNTFPKGGLNDEEINRVVVNLHIPDTPVELE